MKRNTRLSSIIISSAAVVCILVMLLISTTTGFYFGPDDDKLQAASMEIRNELHYKNSIPNWTFFGDGSYGLIFAANLPENEDSYVKEQSYPEDRSSLMLSVIDPFKKEIVQADNNIHTDNLKGENDGNVLLNSGDRYGSIKLGDGLLAYEEDQQQISYSVYYRVRTEKRPVLTLYGNPALAYIKQRGAYKKPVIAVKSLSGGMFAGGSIMGNHQVHEKIIPVPAGELIGWVQGSDLIFSSAKLNKNLQYVDMHDLWTISLNGGQPKKLHENALCPVMYSIDGVVVFLSKEKEGDYSIWKAYYAGKAEKISQFHYVSKDRELPSISIINAKGDQELEVCYTSADEKGQVSIQSVNTKNKIVKTLVKNKNILGPIISSFNIDAGQGKYILYFSEEHGDIKANIIDNQGNFQSEIYDLLKSAPAQPYMKAETKQ